MKRLLLTLVATCALVFAAGTYADTVDTTACGSACGDTCGECGDAGSGCGNDY